MRKDLTTELNSNIVDVEDSWHGTNGTPDFTDYSRFFLKKQKAIFGISWISIQLHICIIFMKEY